MVAPLRDTLGEPQSNFVVCRFNGVRSVANVPPDIDAEICCLYEYCERRCEPRQFVAQEFDRLRWGLPPRMVPMALSEGLVAPSILRPCRTVACEGKGTNIFKIVTYLIYVKHHMDDGCKVEETFKYLAI